MFVTTQGIVLRSYPFKDNRHITKVFTSDDGLLSFIIKKTKKQIFLIIMVIFIYAKFAY